MNVVVLGELDPSQHTALVSLLDRCELADGHPALGDPERAAVARSDLGGHGARVVLASEGETAAGFALLSTAPDGATVIHVAVDPSHRGAAGGDDLRTTLLRTALGESPRGAVRLWSMRATGTDFLAESLGFTLERELVQMRVGLPLAPEAVATARPIRTRAFVPGCDDEAWLDVNNRAFGGHPEQGGWTVETLHARLGAPWFVPEGFRVADAPDGKGLIGSCWTKIHHESHPVMGEIYVISVDPDRHGGGWGRALTVAGLQWLSEQGVPVGMLYTSADNTAAVALYTSLGFHVDHVDRSYLREASPQSG